MGNVLKDKSRTLQSESAVTATEHRQKVSFAEALKRTQERHAETIRKLADM